MTIVAFPSNNLRTFTASELGCALDGVTDDTAILNTFLATATASNPIKLILDGTALVSGLALAAAGYTWIDGLGWGTGLKLAANAYQDAIRIGAYTGGYSEGQNPSTGGISTPPSRTATNIILSNFAIDCTGNASYTPANQPVSGAPVHMNFGVVLFSATNVRVENMQFTNPPGYCLCLSNVSNVVVRDCHFSSGSNFQDGVHIDGPSEGIWVLDCSAATGDDPIAVNCPEGCGGDISDVYISNFRCINSWTAARVYTSNQGNAGADFKARRISFRGVTGTTQNPCFNLGIDADGSTQTINQIEDLLIADCDLSSTGGGLAILQTSFGLLSIVNTVYRAPATTVPAIQANWTSFGEIRLANFTLLRNADGNAAPPIVVYAVESTALGKLTITGLSVLDMLGSSYTAVPYLLDFLGPSTLNGLRLDSVDMTQIAALLNPATAWTNVADAAVSGAGVLGTGAEIPDAAMASDTLYVSATSGVPSMKLAGTVKTLGLS